MRGTGEVRAAVIASTMTTIAVFFPMVFVEGSAGQAFGDGSLALRAPRSASCVSRGEVEVLSMGLQKFIELHDADEQGGSAFRQGIVQNLISQLMSTLDRFVDIETRNQAAGNFADAGTPVSAV